MVAAANLRGMIPSSICCFLAFANVWASAFQVVPKPLAVLRSQHWSSSHTPYISQKECPENKWGHRKPNVESSALYSLNKLVQDVNEATGPRTVFVGGKGGVGKTTVSSALAVALATDMMSDKKILVVSTDPAHSLGDALDVDTSALRAARGRPIQMTDPLTAGRLYACEVDPSAAIENFRENLAAFDIDRMADALGVSASFLDDLGLREFSGLLNNPPPGLDELVALANVLESNPDAQNFDITVVDTAPTGHTLRMLALPQFLDGFLGKLIKLRAKLSGTY
jgi:arsenite-transporting ATPase